MSTHSAPDSTPTQKTASSLQSYVGRFAPSPTGPLHFGSLLAAVASYLDARQNQGQWLVRIEDLDPPREIAGAADDILRTLELYGLHWDSEVIYQSHRHQAYQAALEQLINNGKAYACDCSRLQIQQRGAIQYDDFCRCRQEHIKAQHAIRVMTNDYPIEFTDRLQGQISTELHSSNGDFVIRRKDNLFAYQLAVVVDDNFQNITHTVRGSDLLESTPKQLYLQQLLGFSTPSYGHIPVMVNAEGQKLSKQTFAPALSADTPSTLLSEALRHLGLPVPPELKHQTPESILAWATTYWSFDNLPPTLTINMELI